MKPKFTVLFDAIENGAFDASSNKVMIIQEFGDGTVVFHDNVSAETSCLRDFIDRLYRTRL